MCAWDKTKPAGTDRIRDSDNTIRANNAAIETVLGTNITAGPTSIQDAVRGDGTKGRKLRVIQVIIANGSNASTLKCTVVDKWNGDTIAETDNVAKGATTGNFTLDATGQNLKIEAAGLSGNVLMALGVIHLNESGVALNVSIVAISNDIQMTARHTTTGAAQDMTVLVDTGTFSLNILYITDA